MAAESIGASHRSISDRILRKTLAIGLGSSALLHTAAIAGASYFYQGNIEDLEVVEIERVVDPAPSPKPVAPTVKPIPIPEPKLFKPKTIAAPPIPVLPDVPKLKPIDVPPEQVVKITKSAPKPPPTSPLAKPTAPAPSAPKIAAVIPPKSKPLPAFPNKLFSDPQPKPARTEIATRKIDKPPAQIPPAQDPQPTTATNQAALAPSSKSPKLAPNSVTANEQNSDPNDESVPSSPGSTSKLARTPDKSPLGNNQTSLATQPKSPAGFGDFGAADPNTPPSTDDFAGAPGNSSRIANNIPTTAPTTTNNQVGLGKSPQRGSIGAKFGNSGSDNPNGDDEATSGTPGNNTRIARSNGGGKGVGSQGNQTGLGGGNQRNPSLGGSLNGNGNGSGNGGDDLGGTPGNIATGSKNQATIQCLRNCEIRYPDELENTDVGKDKILVKVTIDPNGLVASAEIARSSGNQKLDRVTVEGVKQMQLNPTGKTRTHRIKISTLLNN